MSPARALYLLFGAGLVIASSLPAFRPPKEDAFPFSTYPMFAKKREAPRFAKAEARQAGQDWAPVPPMFVGTDEIMQAGATVRRAAKNKKLARALCESIVRANQAEYREVRISWVRYDPVAYFVDGPEPLARRTVARCGPDSKKKRKRRR